MTRLTAILLLFCGATAAHAQSKFHLDLDYRYSFGLSESYDGHTLGRDKYKMGGHALHLAARYDITPLWSAGIGAGLDRYTEPDYNTLPVFATVRYKFLSSVPNAYAFADAGYAIKAGDYTQGFTGSLGVGYTHLFTRRFGLNFQLAYNLKQFTGLPYYTIDTASGYASYSEVSSTRHSIALGIGITF
ncbi:MAG: hypothetical protein J6M53_02265 [Bacteroidaceae bacterium]|nr:hypothetical protein [Bacteroidaceae bacterium]